MGLLVFLKKGFESVRNQLSAIRGGPGDVGRGLFPPICKLSNKLTTGDRADAAHQQLTRQVHQRHVLTLWDTT
jgi:hypothetical protein